MAISLSSAILVKRRALAEIRKPHVQLALKTLFSYLSQHAGNPQLQIVFFEGLSDSETVIADAACKIYATYLKVPSTSVAATYAKQTDHASASSDASSEFRFEIGGAGAKEEILIYHTGAPMGTGVTMQGNTTANGGTGSNAVDRASGFVIIGAP